MENPFAEGESRAFRLPVTVLVIFGATGGLTHHKLPPALYNLAYDGFLPEHCLILGVFRTKLTDEQFRDRPGTGGRNLRLTSTQ